MSARVERLYAELDLIHEARISIYSAQEIGTENGRIVRAKLEVLDAREDAIWRIIRQLTRSGGPAVNRGTVAREY